MAHENHQPQDHGHHHSSFFLSGSAPCSIIVFIIGAGLNLRLFQHYGIPIERIFNIPGHEFPSGQELVRSGSHLFVIFIALFGWYKIHLIDYVRPEFVTVFICGGLVSLLCLPLDVWKLKLRQRLVRTLGKCLWPYDRIGSGFIWPTSDVPFFHTFFADGLTSLSKMFKDITIALLMVCQDETSTGYQNRMKHHPLPHFIAACPYLIRMQQCTINYRLARTSTERSLHVLNIVKYVSGVLVIGVGAMPLIFTHWEILPPEDGMVFLICACFNSLYSFVWDIVMDFGLGHPKDEFTSHKYLRPHLVYPKASVYYLAIVSDLLLRILWVTKWTVSWKGLGADFKFVAEIAEVCRRILWNCFRVEWQGIKLGHIAKEHTELPEREPFTADHPVTPKQEKNLDD